MPSNGSTKKKRQKAKKIETQKRKLRAARKRAKARLKQKRPRRRDWPEHPDEWDELEYEQIEAILSPGEEERRRAVEERAYGNQKPDALQD